jgi:hypothetical protein
VDLPFDFLGWPFTCRTYTQVTKNYECDSMGNNCLFGDLDRAGGLSDQQPERHPQTQVPLGVDLFLI